LNSWGTDVFNIRRLQAKTKVQLAVLRDLLFADDCALVARTAADIQLLFDRFASAAMRFGLTVSLKKTEAMHQLYPPHKSAAASVTAGEDVVLQSVDKFCYLGSYMSNIVAIDCDITSRLAKAGSAFGKLQRRLWNVHDVSMLWCSPPCYTVVKPGHYIATQSASWISSTFGVFAK